jgi:hypothetical protein
MQRKYWQSFVCLITWLVDAPKSKVGFGHEVIPNRCNTLHEKSWQVHIPNWRTWTNISLVVNIVSRFGRNSRSLCLDVGMQILRYIKGTLNYVFYFWHGGKGDVLRLHRHKLSKRLWALKVGVELHIHSWFVTNFVECKGNLQNLQLPHQKQSIGWCHKPPKKLCVEVHVDWTSIAQRYKFSQLVVW